MTVAPKKSAIVLTASIFAAHILAGCSGCEKQDDTARIKALIKNAATKAEQHDLGGIMDLATEDFVALPNEMNRRSVKGLLLVAFRQYGKFSIHYPRPTINLDPSSVLAEAIVPFLILRKGRSMPDLSSLYEDPDSWLREAAEVADLFHLELWLIKTDDQWLVKKARIQGTRSFQ